MTDLTLHGGKLAEFLEAQGTDALQREDWNFRHPDVPVYFLARALAERIWLAQNKKLGMPEFLNEETQGLLDRYDRAKRKGELAPADRETIKKAEQNAVIQKVLERRKKVAAISQEIDERLRPYAGYHTRTLGGAGLEFFP